MTVHLVRAEKRRNKSLDSHCLHRSSLPHGTVRFASHVDVYSRLVMLVELLKTVTKRFLVNLPAQHKR